MNVIPVIIYAAELALAAIILFYVVEMLTIPSNMKRIDRGVARLGSAPNKPRRPACSKRTK